MPMNEFISAWFLRNLFSAMAPAGIQSRLIILIFHRVLDCHDPLQPGEPTAEEFESIIRWVKSWFNIIPLFEAVEALRDGLLPERPLSITFDDGYADNHDIAVPILQRYEVPATFFVATGYLDGGAMFNDIVIESIRGARSSHLDLGDLGLASYPIDGLLQKRAAISSILNCIKSLNPEPRDDVVRAIAKRAEIDIPNELMMTSKKVQSLSLAGMEVGAHTVTHPILATVEPTRARSEIVAGKERLEQIVGGPVRFFAYPNGRPTQDYLPEHVHMLRDLGFDAAVSTACGVAGANADLFQLPRFTPWDRSAIPFGLRLAKTMINSNPALATQPSGNFDCGV